MPQFDWLCDVCGCVMSPISGIYWVELGFINNCKEPQLWLVLLRYSADVASAFSWVVTVREGLKWQRERLKQTVLCDDEEWVDGVGSSLGQLRGGSAQGWVAHGGLIGSGVGRLLGQWRWRMGWRSGMGLLSPEWDEQSTHRRVKGTRTAIWPVWSWVRRHDLFLSLCLGVYESFFLSLFLFLRVSRNGLKWK